MTFFPHLQKRIFNTPLMIDPAKLQIIMAALAPRFGLDDAELDAALGGAITASPYASGGSIDYSRMRRACCSRFDDLPKFNVEPNIPPSGTTSNTPPTVPSAVTLM